MADKKPKPGVVKPPAAATAEEKKKPASKSSSKRPPGRPRPLAKQVEEFYVGVAMAVSFADPFSAEIIRQGARSAGESWDALAQKDARVKRWLEKLTTGGVYGALVTSHLAMILPILIHKGVPIPFNPFAGSIDVQAAQEMEAMFRSEPPKKPEGGTGGAAQ